MEVYLPPLHVPDRGQQHPAIRRPFTSRLMRLADLLCQYVLAFMHTHFMSYDHIVHRLSRIFIPFIISIYLILYNVELPSHYLLS